MKKALGENVVELSPTDARRSGGGEDPPSKFLPENCPVTPLGVGPDCHHLLDCLQQYCCVEDGKLGRLKILKLFGGSDYLYAKWPKLNKDGAVVGWRHETVGEDLIRATSARGVWNPATRLRGRGGWRGDDGELVFHCGGAIHVGDEKRAPGAIGRYVYPAGEKLPEPSLRIQRFGANGPAARLLEVLSTWNWARGETDAKLLLGWIGAAMLGGYLRWRPLVWVTGDKSTGKSTLHDLILEHVFDGALVRSTDTTAAGLYQAIGFASLPIAIDELEASSDNARANAIVKLARLAASGGVLLRGGAEHKGVEFQARSCFLFSSILIPPLMGQDLSRLAILELGPLGDRKLPAIKPEELREIGRALRRALVVNAARFDDTFEIYRMGLAAGGHDARGCDQFGALLACADVLLHQDAPDSDSVAAWCEKLKREEMVETQDLEADHQRCVDWLRSSIVDAWKGGTRKSLGQWLKEARSSGDVALDVLAQVGVRIDYQSREEIYVVVANSHRGTSTLFEGSHWATKPGSVGVWRQALKRVPGSRAWRGRIDGAITRGVAIPYELVAADNREERGEML